ncbi:MAG: M48 family metalloprotease, partial [Candidatus Bathyarchaeota archaeon]|nr:M48 family metalloprotease [Candidatus Bathyarchaeota archaeon]
MCRIVVSNTYFSKTTLGFSSEDVFLARLARLRLSMTLSILLVSAIFAVFLVVVISILNLPLIWALFATLLFLIVQYLIGPAIVRGSTHLRYLKSGENPWLYSKVSELSQKSGIPTPKLAIVPEETPNAFVFGRTTSDATLAVHEGLLKKLNQDEVEAVIGHELGHIKHKDYLVVTMLSALPLLVYWVSWGTFEAGRWGGRSSRGKKAGGLVAVFFAVALISYVVYIVTLLCIMGLSRLREHYADSYSAYLTERPRQLQSALAKITYNLSLSPRSTTGARSFYISDPAMAKQESKRIIERRDEFDLDRDGVLDEKELRLAMTKEAKSTWTTINTWFSTHPPTFKRILLLKEMEKEIQTGSFSSKRIYAQ